MSLVSDAAAPNYRIRLAVADDDRRFLGSFVQAMEDLRLSVGIKSNVEILTVASEQEMLDLLCSDSVSHGKLVIFLDIRMERSDSGFRLLRFIRSSPSLSAFPVIIMSSGGLQDDVDRSYQDGANAYFYKPVGIRRGADVVKSQLEYWLRQIELPKTVRRPISFEEPTSSRSKESKWYVLDRLRQDMLVGFLRDLESYHSSRSLDKAVAAEVHRAAWRLVEIFEFRDSLFGDYAHTAAAEFAHAVDQIVTAAQDGAECDATIIFGRARQARINLSSTLRKVRSSGDSDLLGKVDFLILDIFEELASFSGFRELRMSLIRYRKRSGHSG